MSTHDILIGWAIGMAVAIPIIIIGNILFRPELWGYFNIYRYLTNSHLWDTLNNKVNDYRDRRSYLKSIKRLHSHPAVETRYGVDIDKVLVDKEFEYLFDNVFTYWGNRLILVSRDEYLKLKSK